MAWFRPKSEQEDDPARMTVVGNVEGAATSEERQDEWYLTLKRRLHKEVVSSMDLGQMESMTEARVAAGSPPESGGHLAEEF